MILKYRITTLYSSYFYVILKFRTIQLLFINNVLIKPNVIVLSLYYFKGILRPLSLSLSYQPRLYNTVIFEKMHVTFIYAIYYNILSITFSYEVFLTARSESQDCLEKAQF